MMTFDRRRSSIEIIADMLRLGEAGKTEMMYSVNMSYFQLTKYLNFLIERGLVSKIALGNPSVTYRVTNKGLQLLRSIDGILEMMDAKEVDEDHQR
jgi:predicted transcriptional regulator